MCCRFGYGRVVTKIRLSTYWQVTECRRYLGRVMPNLFIRERRVVRLIPRRAAAPVGSPMVQFVSLERVRIRMRSSRKNISHAQ